MRPMHVKEVLVDMSGDEPQGLVTRAASRRSIDIGTYSHENPVPMGSLVGGLLASGVIHGGSSGPDPSSFGSGMAEQCAQMFENVRLLLTAAGGSLDDLLKLEIRLARAEDRSELNTQWLSVFPNEASRPARSVAIGDTNRPHILVQCQVLAVPGVSEREPRA